MVENRVRWGWNGVVRASGEGSLGELEGIS